MNSLHLSLLIASSQDATGPGAELLRASISPKAETVDADFSHSNTGAKILEWGVRLDFMLDTTRGSVFNWPQGEHESWPSRRPIEAPDTHVHDDLFDPHSPLKLSGTKELMALAKDPNTPYAELVAAATSLYAPFLERIARWVPEEMCPTTRIMLLASGGIRAFTEAQQCPLWYAMREVIDASPFSLGLVHLISIPHAAPFHPRTCPKATWADGKAG